MLPWAKILSSFNRRLVIVDGFAGRGEYVDENQISIIDGSPIILMDLSKQVIVDELVCICIEKNKDNYHNLCRVLEEKRSKGIGTEEAANFSNVNIRKFSYEEIDSYTTEIVSHISQNYVRAVERIKPITQKTFIFVVNVEFEKTIRHILSSAKKKGFSSAPSFYFIDPFGFRGIPFQLIKDILLLPKNRGPADIYGSLYQ